MRRGIEELRQKVRAQRYTISGHANEEMSEDELTALDIERAILTGKIAKRFSKDPRGTRYEVVGRASDGRAIGVCRILSNGWLRIFTAYDLER